MKKFKEIKKTGDGTFGVVTKAEDTVTHELVAIKKMKQKYHNFDECTNLREVKALMKLQNHPNIVKLKESIMYLKLVILDTDTLCLVFEFIEKSIYQIYTQHKEQVQRLVIQGKTIPEDQIKSIVYQVANGLSYMHKHGYFHRDLKPENLLMTNSGVLKIIDLGLAREIRSRPPYTDYVATRWYRAPEILLKQANYNSPVDIFALGCIMAELFLNRPLFQGNSELEQFNKILSILGQEYPIFSSFNQQEWPEGCRLVSQLGIQLASYQSLSLKQMIPNASVEAINLLTQMLKWDPYKRITSTQILTHPYFYNIQKIAPALVFEEESANMSGKKNQESQFQIKQQQPQNQTTDLDDILDFITTENKPMPSKKSYHSTTNLEYGEYVPSQPIRQARHQQAQSTESIHKKENSSIYDFSNLQNHKPAKIPNSKY